MARPRSERVEQVREKLRTRASAGVQRPGEKFLSAREVASSFGVSYQTAHRLIADLESEGLLERRAGVGTFIPSSGTSLRGAQLLFSARAKRPHSFGARLLDDLRRRLEQARIEFSLSWIDEEAPASTWSASSLKARLFPVIWESPGAREACVRMKRAALLLNERPQPGLAAGWFDSVSIDDFSGGACAAQLLLPPGREGEARLCVLSGPSHDARSNARRDGFVQACAQSSPRARVQVLEAPSWFFEDGLALAEQAVEAGPDGIFACNDRLAHAVAAWCDEKKIERPRLVGFDDAPIAQGADLTTIAIPWDEVVSGAAEIIRRRLAGGPGGAGAPRQLIVTPRPVVRRL